MKPENKGADIEAAKFEISHTGGKSIGIEVTIKFEGVTHKDERFDSFSFRLNEEISAKDAEKIGDLIPVEGQTANMADGEGRIFFAGWKLDKKGLRDAIERNGEGGELSKYALMKLMAVGAIDEAISEDGVLTK